MSGNTFGLLYCVTSFGESHGPAYGGVVDGCPPGLELSAADIQKELDRRKPGSSRHVTQRRESDAVEILSGVYQGRTTGTAIGFLAQLGSIEIPFKNWEAVEANPFFAPDDALVKKLEAFMDELRASGDSCG